MLNNLGTKKDNDSEGMTGQTPSLSFQLTQKIIVLQNSKIIFNLPARAGTVFLDAVLAHILISYSFHASRKYDSTSALKLQEVFKIFFAIYMLFMIIS